MKKDTLLQVESLKQHFPIRKGFFSRIVNYVRAVDDVTFTIYEGEIFGLVGESGCGKTTTGRTIMRAYEPTSGRMLFRDKDMGEIDLATLPDQDLRTVWRNIQMIFQDPFSSLNPRMTLQQIVGEPMQNYNISHGRDLEERVASLLRTVGLRPEQMSRYPHAFSGGQRQRIGIARALALNPQLIVCDEPVSALDVSIQAQVLNLLKELQGKFGLSYLFIAHDLSVVKHICDRIAVMYVGKLVELSDTDDLFANPLHPYTEALLSAVPKPDPRAKRDRIVLDGDVADPANPPGGCYFHPRCQYVEQRCKTETPNLRELRPGHFVSCHRADELSLVGV